MQPTKHAFKQHNLKMQENNCKTHKKRVQLDPTELQTWSKDDLIAKIVQLQAHNQQLQNVILKKDSPGKSSSRTLKRSRPFDFASCKYRHVLLRILYLGWDLQGFAVQEDTVDTVEHHLFEALKKTCLIKDRASSNYHRCGRTDKGVSSFGQVISLDLRSKGTEEGEELDYCTILNRVLPKFIQCIAWAPVEPNFSARFDCTGRTYKYFFPAQGLDVQKMQEAAQLLVGTHDFRNFCKMDIQNGVVEFTRKITKITFETIDTQFYVATIEGQAFLWHQIRCIMSVLHLIGKNLEEANVILTLLDVKNNPRKPDYRMASEIPLNLYSCNYEEKVQFIYSQQVIEHLYQNLQEMWTKLAVKTTMLKYMLQDLSNKATSQTLAKPSRFLFDESMKNGQYVALLNRQKCESLEVKLNNLKRKKTSI